MIDKESLIADLESWRDRLDAENDDLLIVVLDLVIDKVKAVPEIDKWKDGKPDKKGDYLVYFPSGFMEVLEFADGRFWEGRDEVLPAKWMELPKKPKLSVREMLFGRKKD